MSQLNGQDFCLEKFSIQIFLLSLAPSRAPYLVTTHNYSSSSLIIRWSHLLREDFHGLPICYIISYYPVDLKRDVKFLRVNYTTNTTTLTNLTVYTMYVINVSAVSSGGIGPANTVKAQTRAEGRKDILYDTFCNCEKAYTFSINLS